MAAAAAAGRCMLHDLLHDLRDLALTAGPVCHPLSARVRAAGSQMQFSLFFATPGLFVMS